MIGASGDGETLRGRLTRALIGHGYPGRVYPVTRSQREILGLGAYPAVADLPEAADLAIVLVPAAVVPETLEACGRRGIGAAIVISSGFAEEEGEAAQARGDALRRIARRHGILVAALSRFAADHADQIAEIDLNPVIVHPRGQGLSIVDALILRGRPKMN